MRAGDGVPVEFSVRGVGYTVDPGSEVVAPLADQGPVIPGRPSLRELIGERREDGTLLSASVPTTETTSIPVISGAVPVIDVSDGALGR